MKIDNKKAIFAGSFDPFHKGHEQVVEQALKLFGTVYIVVSKNPRKEATNSWNDRVKAIEKHYNGNSRVVVLLNKNKLTAEFAKDLGVHFLVRGIRDKTDFKYEYEMAQTNKALNKDLETVFFFSDEANVKISSSFIKDIESFKKED